MTENLRPPNQNNDKNNDTPKTEATSADKLIFEKVIKKELIEKKKEEQFNLEIMRKDPTSPLYSVKTFEALHL